MHLIMRKWIILSAAAVLSLCIIFTEEHVQAKSSDGSAKDWIEQPEKSGQIDEKLEENNIQPSPLNFGVKDGLNMIGALIFVIAILYFLLKFVNKKNQSYQQNRIVQHLGGTSLGANRSVQIVKAGKQILILGVGEDVKLLSEVVDEQEKTDIIRNYEEQQEFKLEPGNLISTLRKVWKDRMKSAEKSPKPFQNHLHEQLEEVKKGRRNAMNKLNQKEPYSDE